MGLTLLNRKHFVILQYLFLFLLQTLVYTSEIVINSLPKNIFVAYFSKKCEKIRLIYLSIVVLIVDSERKFFSNLNDVNFCFVLADYLFLQLLVEVSVIYRHAEVKKID